MDRLAGPDWYGIFKDLHAGLILDLANYKKEAGKRYESAYKADPAALRTVQAYGRYLSRNGDKDAALEDLSGLRQGAARPSADQRGDEGNRGRRQAAAADRFGRRPAPPRRFTASAPRSAAAAARIWRSSICSLRSICSRRIRWRLLSLADLYECSKSPIWRSRSTIASRHRRRCYAQRRNPARHRSRRARPHR